MGSNDLVLGTKPQMTNQPASALRSSEMDDILNSHAGAGPQLRLSRFAHCIQTKNGACVYNASTLERVYGNIELANLYRCLQQVGSVPPSALESPTVKRLVSHGILVSSHRADDQAIEHLREHAISNQEIDNIFIFLTEECNFTCQYCYVRRNISKSTGSVSMTSEIAEQTVSFIGTLAASLHLPMLYVIFYGGEPLLNWENLQRIVQGLDRNDSLAKCNFNFRIITNGSLLNDNHMAFFEEYGIVPTISLDGADDMNYNQRVRPSRFRNAERRALNLLANRGIPYELSVTVSRGNVGRLPEHLKEIIQEFAPYSVRINVPEAYRGFDRNDFLDLSADLSEVWVESFKVIQECGVTMSNSGMDSFLQKDPQYFPCSGAKRRLAISPRGEISSCESFLTQRKHLRGTVWDHPSNLSSSEREKWLSRSAFNMPECQDCVALGICAGGCAYNAEMLNHEFFSRDDSICAVAKASVRSFLEEGIAYANNQTDFLSKPK